MLATLSAAGIDPDDGVARPEQQTVDDRGGDPKRIICGVIGLETRGEAARQSNRRAETA